jgi:hypothetical protein
MKFYDPQTLLFSIQALLLIALLIGLYRLRKKELYIRRQLQDTGRELDRVKKENNDLTRRLMQLRSFQENLKDAELTTRFQQPRLQGASTQQQPGPRGRYHFIRSLEDKGMDLDEIARVLGISPHETEQILALSKIAEKNE